MIASYEQIEIIWTGGIAVSSLFEDLQLGLQEAIMHAKGEIKCRSTIWNSGATEMMLRGITRSLLSVSEAIIISDRPYSHYRCPLLVLTYRINYETNLFEIDPFFRL